jgi:cellulose synthase/poly-beta-1,6-N-acetylglucosamine synthase-like glycosyltransferase
MNPRGDEVCLAAWIFWASLLFIAYTYGAYPLLAAALARLRPRPVRRRRGHQPPLSVVLAVYNEASHLRRRVRNLLDQDYPAERAEVIIASDGSTDETNQIAEGLAAENPRVKFVALGQNQGKAAALNAAVAAARGELLVFADARQIFAPDALARLAENFADPAVGSASGELILVGPMGPMSPMSPMRNDAGVATQIGLYWRYEKWIRRSESTFGSMLGASGAIYAIRRCLWRPLPPDTILDDFLTPMRAVLQGARAVFDGRAMAFDRPSTRAAQELRRKVRTLAGNFQAFAFEPALLSPRRNPATCFQLWSHKLFRLFVPWFLLLALAASIFAAGSLYTAATIVQAIFYGMALAGWSLERAGRPIRWRPVSLAYTFVTLNLAAALAHWPACRRRWTRRLWRKAY